MPSILDIASSLDAGATVCTACAAGSFYGATGMPALVRARIDDSAHPSYCCASVSRFDWCGLCVVLNVFVRIDKKGILKLIPVRSNTRPTHLRLLQAFLTWEAFKLIQAIEAVKLNPMAWRTPR
jgi:hypothetical protein